MPITTATTKIYIFTQTFLHTQKYTHTQWVAVFPISIAKIPSNTIPRQNQQPKFLTTNNKCSSNNPRELTDSKPHITTAGCKGTPRHTHAQNSWCLGPHMKLQEGIPMRQPTHKFKTESKDYRKETGTSLVAHTAKRARTKRGAQR
jgi:hypothetical protein